MSRASSRTLRFVRALLAGVTARRDGEMFRCQGGERAASLDADAVMALIADGVFAGDGEECRATAATAQWLRRNLVDHDDAFAGQHRLETVDREGVRRNLAESPLARLAARGPNEAEPFLAPHQVEAGERVRRLAERALLRPRVTMSYSAAHTAGGSGGGRAADLTDLAMEARRALDEVHRLLPRDCAGVVLDVCAGLKGLQEIEIERGWPRRSAKLVLRIGLDRLAEHYGLSAEARGETNRRKHRWMDGERPEMFG
jgi:hypothetical protein